MNSVNKAPVSMLQERLRLNRMGSPEEMAACLRNYLEVERVNKSEQAAAASYEPVICLDRLRPVV